jgi:hypothetical protein
MLLSVLFDRAIVIALEAGGPAQIPGAPARTASCRYDPYAVSRAHRVGPVLE